MVPSKKKSERGKLLTFLILIHAAFLAFYPYFVFSNLEIILAAYDPLPFWYVPYLLINYLALITALIGLWRMRKWGIYFLFVPMLFSLIIYLAKPPLNRPPLHIEISSILVGSFIWIWAIQRKRQFFK